MFNRKNLFKKTKLKNKLFASFNKFDNKHFFPMRNVFNKPTLIENTRNIDILHDPLINKGTSFSPSERERQNSFSFSFSFFLF